ncbi:MAG: hypothetical protein ACLUVP_00855 [Acutalibacter sp.]
MKNKTIQALLEGREENHQLPFLWLHGEDEATLRQMMAVIHGANCGAVCLESRTHPDFCGPQWWHDLDIILEEAKARGMRVWILDDKHYPSGMANGALLQAPEELCRQNIFCNRLTLGQEAGPAALSLRQAGLLEGPGPTQEDIRQGFLPGEPARRFDPAGDRVLTVQAVKDGAVLDLSPFLQGEELRWDKPAGDWELQVVAASRNTGFHRDYINMLDKASVRLLLEAVYEPHWQRYSQEFGKTLAGFFSDEPNLGNGPTYTKGNTLGCGQDLPWSRELESALEESWGPGWRQELPRLFSQDSGEETARFHTATDLVTKLVREDFSQQVADWCHQRGVAYIGHVIEDDGQHCRTGSSLGHFFRGLQGQDMAGIDDIGGQVLPQGEDGPTLNPKGRPRNGEFYHYGLGTLAASSAALEPGKAGNAMCEIFGNYRWQEGVRLEKYLADHFLVRGINYFVPHAFTGHPFPDPDCPPHFYAQGRNPQYRHFGKLLQAMNRVATVTSSGPHRVEAAVLYHGESEWCDPQAMAFEHALRPLYDQQIHCHVVPADVFAEPERYHTQLGNPLVINGRRYQAFVVPGAKRLPAAAAAGLEALVQAGLPVFFAGEMPLGLCEGGPLPSALEACPVLEPAALPGALREAGVAAPAASPACDRLRLLVVEGESPCVVLSNEGTEPYVGTVSFPGLEGPCFWYDPWHNRCQRALSETTAAGLEVQVEVEPLQLRVLALGQAPAELHTPWEKGQELALRGWKRSLCAGVEYPAFGPAVPVELPDQLAQELPEFSGYARYEAAFQLGEEGPLVLELSDAAEGVEVFLNGESQGLQIAPPFRYELRGQAGENLLAIEVATTLERHCHAIQAGGPDRELCCGSGLTGTARLFLGKNT